MRFKQITPSVYTLSMGFVNVFLIKAENELCLIDAGVPEKAKVIIKAIQAAGLNADNLKHIILTHLHKDHTGSLRELKDLTGARIYSHESEAAAIEEGLIMRPCTPAPGFIKGLFVNLMLKGKSPKKLPKGTPVDIKLKGDEMLPIGPGIKVIATPGHTVGHISLLVQEAGGVFIAGDVGSGGKKPGYPVLFEDKEQGLETLKRLGELNFDKALFSHGKPIMSGASDLFEYPE